MSSESKATDLPEQAIAIVGMAGRFPGARNVDAYWELLREGREAVTFFDEVELIENGIDPEIVKRPNYVKAKPVLDDCEQFDAAFFQINPREAELMDPQQRLFLECAWEAIESAAHDPWTHPGRIGVFAGAGKNTYLLLNLLSQADWMHSDELFKLLLGNEKDYLSTRVSYKLNLKGPSITVQTACSSSLVAVHLACQSLLLGECDIALAGGVSVDVPRAGYLYRAGGILSPDGHCRAFDSEARGVTFGNGVGVVVLRRASDALADADFIQALIRGTAVNNDGADRAGFTAPSVNGQAQAITEALAVSGLAADTITYVEAHGTATPVGDPIELQGLTQAFRRHTARTQYCALGSVKTNIGHLGAAAGIAGLIKTVLALKHQEIPPSLHFTKPNPQIDFANSPFFVNAKRRPWESADVRRAGVSSFGQGGTNAHVVLEEAPAWTRPVNECSRGEQVLVLSAQTPAALAAVTERLADFLSRTEFALADIAFTLQAGRTRFNFRRFLVCSDKQQAAAFLRALDPARVIDGFSAATSGEVEFVFADDISLADRDAALQLWRRWGVRPSSVRDSRTARSTDTIKLLIGSFPQRVNEETSNCLEIDGNDLPAAIGKLWLAGVQIDWSGYHSGYAVRRVPLPAYPFQRRRHWIEPLPPTVAHENNGNHAHTGNHNDHSQVELQLIQIYRDLLGVETVSPQDDFFELGGDSLLEMQFRDRVKERFGVTLSEGVLLDHATVSKVAPLVMESAAGTKKKRRSNALAADIALDESISATGIEFATGCRNIFLTGVTGLLGSHLLAELLAATSARIYCLVRAENTEQAYQRLRKIETLYNLDFMRLKQRIIPILGDLSLPKFGVGEAGWDELAATLDVIYHCGASVNFIQSYQALKRVNVHGTREVLCLAAHKRVKPLHHISSIAVFESESLSAVTQVSENQDLGHCDDLHNGYDMTKWVGEQIIGLARERGLPVSIYRLSNVGGHSRTGIMLPQHIVCSLIKGCVQLGLAPEADNIINLIPVDAASRMLVAISLQPESLGKNFHVVNPGSTRIGDIVKWLNEHGYAIELRSYVEWREALRATTPDNAFRVFLPLLDEAPLFTNRSYDMSNVRRYISGRDFDCPQFDRQLLACYLSHMVSSGCLPLADPIRFEAARAVVQTHVS